MISDAAFGAMFLIIGLFTFIGFIVILWCGLKEAETNRNKETEKSKSQVQPKGVTLSNCGLDNKEETKKYE